AEITPRTRRYPPAKGAAGRPMTWSHVMTSGSVVVGGSATAAHCDEPSKHDADTAPTSTATTSRPSFNRTHEPYAHASPGGHATVTLAIMLEAGAGRASVRGQTRSGSDPNPACATGV